MKKLLLTGATGYVGGRLLRHLRERGFDVRCLVRRPEYLRTRVGNDVDLVQGDVLDKASLTNVLSGIGAAYYLVHSMGSRHDFEELDRTAASNFGEAAREGGLSRIVYLGGLGEADPDLSVHLRSRQEVGRVLASFGIPVVELRASIVIGSGSLSFELIRALVERLPVMITPRWVSVKAQPIAISDLLEYLVQALHVEATGHRIFEIGGKDRMSYGDLMNEYARQRGVRRLMISVPVLSPRLSSLWLGLVTPVYARVGRKLVDSLRHPTVVTDTSAETAFAIRPKGVSEAIAAALQSEDREFAETRWSDAVSAAGAEKNWGGVRFGNRLIHRRTAVAAVSPEAAFRPIQQIGGQNGWYAANWLWRLRGFIDLLFGGVGMRRGRPHPSQLHVGDAVDWWRVEALEPNKRLRLTAEMKLPGRAWLEFEVGGDDGRATIQQTAIFDPVGLLGLAYWYLVYPLHALVFSGMLRGIVKAAERPAAHVARAAGAGGKKLLEDRLSERGS